jgi:type II secretory ATPase GspE/PulE/Tfp pilus assembly ATPase PilB-like protein
VCVSCRRPADPSREALRFLGLSRADLAGAALVEGAGCDACDHTGYHGRVGIHEVLLPDDDFRDAILRRASGKDLRALARKLDGFFTLQEDGIMAAVNGVTTIAEIAANVPRDDGARRPLELRDATPARRNA